MKAVHTEESVNLVKCRDSLIMAVDVMASFRHKEFLRSCVCRRKKGRFDSGRLINRVGAITSAEWEIVLAQNNIDRTCESRRWLQYIEDREKLAKRVCLFGCDLRVEGCGTS